MEFLGVLNKLLGSLPIPRVDGEKLFMFAALDIGNIWKVRTDFCLMGDLLIWRLLLDP